MPRVATLARPDEISTRRDIGPSEDIDSAEPAARFADGEEDDDALPARGEGTPKASQPDVALHGSKN